MSEIEKGFYSFPNVGFYLEKVPCDILLSLKKEIEKIENNIDNQLSCSNRLAGNIEKEFDLIDNRSIVENYVLNLLPDYDSHQNYLSSYSCLDHNLPLGLQRLWVNFQKKHEFNPNHNHSGVMSFVIWIQIPYDLETELQQGPGRYSNGNVASVFQFNYVDVLGSMRNYELPIDKNYEGVICMFPNKLMHCVYPFYSSDEYRISVAGNICLKVNI